MGNLPQLFCLKVQLVDFASEADFDRETLSIECTCLSILQQT